jgi:hypothetical protein
MVETVHLRASYRYATTRTRDDAVTAAVGALSDPSLRCAFGIVAGGAIGPIVTVDFEVPLFADVDLAVFSLLARGCIESRLQQVQSTVQI